MKKVGSMELYTHEEMLDRVIGQQGSQARDEFERTLDEDIKAWRMGEAIKNARLQQNLTQEQLAERIGLTQANLSILKTGKAKAVRFSTLEAVCRELGCQPGDILEYRDET